MWRFSVRAANVEAVDEDKRLAPDWSTGPLRPPGRHRAIPVARSAPGGDFGMVAFLVNNGGLIEHAINRIAVAGKLSPLVGCGSLRAVAGHAFAGRGVAPQRRYRRRKRQLIHRRHRAISNLGGRFGARNAEYGPDEVGRTRVRCRARPGLFDPARTDVCGHNPADDVSWVAGQPIARLAEPE